MLQELENRLAPATFTVTNILDNGGVNPAPGAGTGTLRQAIIDVNATPGNNNIVFAIPMSGQQVIQLEAKLPAITNTVNILGDSQPGFSTSHVFLPGPVVLAFVPLIVIDGTNTGAGADGLTFAAGSDQSQATYLVVRNFSGDGIVVNNSASNRLFNVVVQRNGGTGVHFTGAMTHDNLLQNSFIGTDFSGTQSTDNINGVSQFVGNSGDGVLIDNLAHDNTLGGGKYFLYKNVIGNNGGNGLHITGGASRNLIQANFIGAAAGNDGTALPNAGDGMLVEGNSDGNQLGGVLGLGGLISGNRLNGVEIRGQASNTLVENLFLGIEAFMPFALPNGGNGILVTTTGGGTVIQVNPISGNKGNGIEIAGDAADVTIQANTIGLDTFSTFPVPNQSDGILIHDNAHNILIGGSVPLHNSPKTINFIAANQGNGITVSGNASNVRIQGNLIGLGTVPTQRFGNGSNGVAISTSAGNVMVGGSNSLLDGNTIVFNGSNGVLVSGSSGNPILSNRIFSNSQRGIALTQGGNNDEPAPALVAAFQSGHETVITGTVRGAPSTALSIQLFDNETSDPSGFGQGAELLDTVTVTTDSQGRAAFTHRVTQLVAVGHFSTATATDPNGNTSQFSNATPIIAVGTNAGFVEALYLDLLQRAGDVTLANDAGGWVNALAAGTLTPAAVAQSIARSPEALGVVVKGLYLSLLGRPAMGGEDAGWIQLLQAGGTQEQVIAGILASPEFAARASTLVSPPSANADADFLGALYVVVLGRQGTASEVNSWLPALGTMGRVGVANALLRSPEFRTSIVEQLYGFMPAPAASVASPFPNLLHRTAAPAAAEVSGWVNSGLDLSALEVAFAGSAEFFSNS